MSLENKTHFLKLVARYLNGSATEQERKTMESYYELFNEAPDPEDSCDPTDMADLGTEMKEGIDRRIQSLESRSTFWRKQSFQLAATLLLLIGAIWLYKTYQTAKTVQPIRESRLAVKPGLINRFILLSDGTKVVLHGHSQLQVDPDFNKKQRTVHLTGEAYFDVAHQAHSPFVIYTGQIKTTVLGTAFNIKAWPQQKDITVSVARGKVKVEGPNKVLALLTSDKQFTYNTENATSNEKLIEITPTWMQDDVTFDDLPFKDIASILSKRYMQSIQFASPELEKCRFTGRFTGTETLEEALKTLTITSNSQFKFDNDRVIIYGEKCD